MQEHALIADNLFLAVEPVSLFSLHDDAISR